MRTSYEGEDRGEPLARKEGPRLNEHDKLRSPAGCGEKGGQEEAGC